MEIAHEQKDGIEIFRFVGNLALTGVKEAKVVVKPLVDDESVAKVVINMEGVSLIDSSGIGFLVSVYNTMKKRSAQFVLCSLNEVIRDIFKSARLDTILAIEENEEKALSSF